MAVMNHIKNWRKVIYSLVLLLVVAGGLVFANRSIIKGKPEKSTLKPLSAAEQEAELKRWEATPDGLNFKKWEASPAGKKVLAAADKISDPVRDSSNMEAVVTALSLPPGSRLGFGVMVRIKGEDYILSFGPERADEFQSLHSLKVNDKIIIRSHFVSYAPKYAYPIVAGDYVERNGEIMYNPPPRKGGC